MKQLPFLKLTALTTALVVIPFLSGILIGKISESLLTKNGTATIASTGEVTKQNQPIIIPAIDEAHPVITNADPEPTVAAAVTSQPINQPVPPPAKTSKSEIKAAAPVVVPCSGSLSQKFLCLLNDYRDSKGLGKVNLNSNLSQVALSHSTWMQQSGIFSHTGLNGTRMVERCSGAGIRCLAENLAEGILDADELLSSWSANPSHNKNLLGPYTTIGFGVSGSYVTLLLN